MYVTIGVEPGLGAIAGGCVAGPGIAVPPGEPRRLGAAHVQHLPPLHCRGPRPDGYVVCVAVPQEHWILFQRPAGAVTFLC